MEHHRLTQMPEGYDQKLFNEIYDQTKLLRRKLTSQIDCRRFGVDYQEILSWFDVKFIHAFCKYYGTMEPNILKGHIISSLQFFKNRILRFSYSQKAQVHNTIDIQEVYSARETQIDPNYDEQQLYLQIALKFIKARVSNEAYRILEIELNPPHYILEQLSDQNKPSHTKIPSNLLADYLGFGTDDRSVRLVNTLRKEVQGAVMEAQQHFAQVELV